MPNVQITETVPNPTTNESADFVTSAEFKLLEKANISAALQHTGGQIWGKPGAAALLGIKPSTLAHQIKKLEIQTTK